MDSIFRVLELVGDEIDELTKPPEPDLESHLEFRSTKLDRFRVYRDFFIPYESHDIFFLNARIAILCTRGFQIMDIEKRVYFFHVDHLHLLIRHSGSGLPRSLTAKANH